MATPRDDAPDVVRLLLGRPALWNAAVSTAIGIAWLVVAIAEGFAGMHIVFLTFWLALGAAQGTIAVRDRRLHRGRYARGA
jgi:hypothetical protein